MVIQQLLFEPVLHIPFLALQNHLEILTKVSHHLTIYQTREFIPAPIESICRQQKNVTENLKFVLEMVENIVGKGGNAGLPAFSPFPTMFSEAFPFRVNCVKEKSL